MRDTRKLWNTVASHYDVIWEVADYSSVLESIVEGADIDLGMRVIDIAAEVIRATQYAVYPSRCT